LPPKKRKKPVSSPPPRLKRLRSKKTGRIHARKAGAASGSRKKSLARKRRIAAKGQRRFKRVRLPAKRRSRLSPVRVRETRPAIHVPSLELPEVSRYDPASVSPGTPGKKLNILYLVHQFYPEAYTGTEKFVLTMAKSMLAGGHRVKVATYSGGEPDTFPHTHGEVVYREYDYDGVPVIAYRHKSLDPARSFGIGHPDLASFADELITEEQPDLLHIGHPMRAMEFIQASLRLGVPYVITLTDFWFLCPKGIMLHTSRNLCAGPEQGAACLQHCQIPGVEQRFATHIPLLQAARKILSPSAFLASMMKYSLPDLKVEVLNHGIHRDPALGNNKTYKRGDTLTLFYGGSLNDHKGVHLLLEAMALVPSKKLKLKIYGSGPTAYTERLRLEAAKDRRVELCGLYSESEIPDIYQNADVAIVPSVWYENYPLVLYEALSLNVPALVSNAGGMSEKVKDGVNGYTFRLGDAAHLASRLRTLLKNPALLNTFKANLRNDPVPTMEQEAQAYESIYYSCAR